VEIAEIVAQALETAAPLLEQKSHRLRIDVPPHGLVVHGDPARLAQVVANLLSNAAKYTPSEGSVEIQARAEEGQAVITVRDNGVGIPRHLLPSIFDSFVQGPRSRDRSEGGLGLGLAIVKTLVELHGGSVGARSDGAGGGAELTVRMPLAPAWSMEAAARSSTTRTQPEPRSLRVLVVDDNADTAHTLGELLEVLGCQVATANDGATALAVAQEHGPELVLLDIGLPVMDGYEVARRLRELPGGADLRLVAVTGYGQQVDREISKSSGFDQHYVKPLVFEQLRQLLSTARRQREEVTETGPSPTPAEVSELRETSPPEVAET
jgi:CheY-like chemotaxis protein